MQLTQKQIEEYNENGFLLIRNFISRDEVAKIAKHVYAVVKNPTEPIESEEEYHDIDDRDSFTLRRVRQVFDRDETIAAWMQDARIRPILRTLLGETPVLTLAHHNSIMTKMPSQISNTCWHQDRRYWNFADDNLLSVWLALEEEYLENGLLEFIPGSHKLDFSPERFDAKICFREDLPQNRALIEKRVHYELHPGDIVLFHCKTLHAASNNKTDGAKTALVYTVKGIRTKPIPGTRSASRPEIVLS